ncbi:hypothetical protein HX13_21835 [Chryseobacterium sp. P1-3]|uniref:Uncharacterized protein n=2 Tax=Chryseobacterium gallinarum TaxID=1324352 RepID=A0A0G3M9D5_CHRGL|nr:hypothetical protein OK18_14430 [Chryseobacterium gallinarum]KFF73255.1 hypothetical protein HX13_21835 [Chryseobacterium sp. P1-3]
MIQNTKNNLNTNIMKHLVIILGLVFSTGYALPVSSENNKNSHTNEKTKAVMPAKKMLINTYYVVNRRTGVLPRNAAEAEQIADVSAPYGNVAYLSNSACRSWWLNKAVVPGPNSVPWSYYYSSGGIVNVTGNYFLLACPL